MRLFRAYRVQSGLPVFYALACAFGFLAAIIVFRSHVPSPEAPAYYSYGELRASNGVTLHAIRTTPFHIGLKAVASNLTKLPDYGINGGFFWEGYLLSIAVINDRPVKGAVGDYGSGWFNTDRKKGTLVWDGATQRFSVQVVEGAGELAVTDRANYWAQGGVSMNLQDDGNWVRHATEEDMPNLEQPRMRSGMVYDAQKRIWLLVSPQPCTVEQFRSAIKEKLRPHQAIDGVFLDGDGSSQLNLAKVALPGDHREVYQMVTLVP